MTFRMMRLSLHSMMWLKFLNKRKIWLNLIRLRSNRRRIKSINRKMRPMVKFNWSRATPISIHIRLQILRSKLLKPQKIKNESKFLPKLTNNSHQENWRRFLSKKFRLKRCHWSSQHQRRRRLQRSQSSNRLHLSKSSKLFNSSSQQHPQVINHHSGAVAYPAFGQLHHLLPTWPAQPKKQCRRMQTQLRNRSLSIRHRSSKSRSRGRSRLASKQRGRPSWRNSKSWRGRRESGCRPSRMKNGPRRKGSKPWRGSRRRRPERRRWWRRRKLSRNDCSKKNRSARRRRELRKRG